MTAAQRILRLARFGIVAGLGVLLPATAVSCAARTAGQAESAGAGWSSGTVTTSAVTTSSTTGTTPADPTPKVWAPAGASDPIVLSDPADGAVITVELGDRVQIPDNGSLGGVVLDDWDTSLVPYGAAGTFLAVRPGTVGGAITEYDTDTPCIPPQPVSEFELRVADRGPAPKIGDPVTVTPDLAGQTIHLVPGQQIVGRQHAMLSVGDHDEGVLWQRARTGWALKPGTASLAVATADPPTGKDDWFSVQVVVDDPGPVPRGLHGNAAVVAAVVAAAPAVPARLPGPHLGCG